MTTYQEYYQLLRVSAKNNSKSYCRQIFKTQYFKKHNINDKLMITHESEKGRRCKQKIFQTFIFWPQKCSPSVIFHHFFDWK